MPNVIEQDLVLLSDPAGLGPVAMGARDAKMIGDCEIRIRGEAEKLGPTVPRGYLTVFDVPGAPKINLQQSGRLELAQWLTHEKNPLTPRVMVNRVWHHLFGQGLVSSVDNFGVTGDSPSHPELLDHLATRFMKDGWSTKKLIRTLVLTRTYQLASILPSPPQRGAGAFLPSPSGRGAGGEGEPFALHQKSDPANRLLWRHSPRRLSAEEIRDAMLAASGKLDLSRLKGSPAMDLKVIELNNVSPLAKSLEEAAKTSRHRSVYLPLVRGITPRSLEVFDLAEQGMVTGSRDSTTVATQALYLLNDAFVRQQAQTLAQTLVQAKLDDDTRVSLAYQSTLSRPATPKEIERARSYLHVYENAARADGVSTPRIAAWASFNQALFASAEFRYVR